MGSWYDGLSVWRLYADDVRGQPIAAGHSLAEKAPGETLVAL